MTWREASARPWGGRFGFAIACPGKNLDMDETERLTIEEDVPEADAVEQHRSTIPGDPGDDPTDIPPDVPEADALEQARTVQLDEEADADRRR
jgi:hypothetical protein